jgi:hypothetical protein
MPIDPRIAMSFKPSYELESPQNILANVTRQRGAEQAQQMNALAMEDRQRGIASQNALNRAMSAAYDPTTGRPNVSKVTAELAESGYGAQIPGVLKSESERTEAENKSQESRSKLLASKLAQSKDALEQYVKTPEQMRQYNAANIDDPVIGEYMRLRGITLDKLNQEVDAVEAAGPQAFNRYLQKQVLGAKEFLKANEGKLYFPQGSDNAYVYNPYEGSVTQVPGLNTGASQRMTPYQQGQQDVARQRLGIEERELELKQRKAANENAPTINPKEIQKREAVFPQATSALKGFEAKSDGFMADLQKLRDHPGLSQITGLVAGRVPGLTDAGRAAQALYDKVVAKGGFQALQDLRDASKTGGALGSVSNQEGKQLVASFAAIDRRQSAKDVQDAIDQAISGIEGSKVRMREAYDSTYDYRNKGAEPSKAQPASGSLTPEEQAELEQLRARFPRR